MSFLQILLLLLLVATLGALIGGVVLMLVGGKRNEQFGNKMMVARVTLQGLALFLVVAIYYTGK